MASPIDPAAPDPDPDPGPAADPESDVGPPTRPRRLRAAVIAGAAAVLVVIALIAALTARAPLPMRVATPSMPGTTLLAYERMRDLAVRPGDITYQPEGYTVYQPRGRTVAVALRCVGDGRVRISAGERFDFRCDDRERVLRVKAAAPRNGPFIVMGTTVGDVVWSARIVLLDPQQVSGAIPDFRSPCSSCTVVEG